MAINEDTAEKLNQLVQLSISMWYEVVDCGGGHPGCMGPSRNPNEFWSPMYGDLKGAAEAINQIAAKIKRDRIDIHNDITIQDII